MKKISKWGSIAAIGLLLIVALWWAIPSVIDRKESLNQADAFVYSNNAMLYWFELKSHKGRVEGFLHEEKLIEETGKPPYIKKKLYPLTGKKTTKGYVFKVKEGKKAISYNAWFSGPHLAIQRQGEKEHLLYNPVNLKELNEYEQALLDYYMEERKNEQIRKFFTELRNVYGYLHTAENGSYQLFIKFDEALLEGELTGSLLMMTDTGNKAHPYDETRYVLNGVTGGSRVKLFTTVDGKEKKLDGEFHDGANEIELSFWTTDEKLIFHAITEEEFKQSCVDFKDKVQK